MAHDFVIGLLDDDETKAKAQAAFLTKAKAQAAFFGYAEAVFYRAFGAQGFNGGVSGNGGSKVITHAEAKDGLLFAINSDAIANYPDGSRIDDVRNFYEEHVKNADSSAKYFVWFG